MVKDDARGTKRLLKGGGLILNGGWHSRRSESEPSEVGVNGKFLFNLKHSLKVIVMLGILMPATAPDTFVRPMTYNLWRWQPSVRI